MGVQTTCTWCEGNFVSSDVDLLARAQRGDRDAFAALYDRHVRPVYWQAYSVVHGNEVAEDVTQEAFVTMWRRIRDIECVDDSVLPWLLVTAKFIGYNTVRREKRRAHDDIGDKGHKGPAIIAQNPGNLWLFCHQSNTQFLEKRA